MAIAQSGPLEITGRVLEGNSKQPIPFATVMVYEAPGRKMLAGTTTNDDGAFSVMANIYGVGAQLEVSFIGFETKTFTTLEAKDGKVVLGTIMLSESGLNLNEVVVSAEKSQTEFKLDKRVFNVGQDLSSTGMSALELLNNVPSVSVSIEGQISLRGSTGVQILINGKPSVLASDGGNALGTITSDMIERVEVITNPSAKHEAEGTSGIINIVIKKEERKGMNGSISLNTGVPHNHSIGLSLNRRTEKFNLFTQLGGGYRSMPQDEEDINKDLTTGETIYSEGRAYRNEAFYNITLGTDYYFDAKNVLTISGNFAYELEDQPSSYNFERTDGTGNLLSAWNRREETDAKNPKWQYELQYKRDFKDHKEHDLLFSALGSHFSKDQSSEFVNQFSGAAQEDTYQRTATEFGEVNYTFKLDYTQPFAGGYTLEAGSQYLIQDVSNDYSVSNLEQGAWVVDEGLTNLFEYKQNVLGVYATGAYEGKVWGAKVGLRLENTDLNTLLANTGAKNNDNYTNLFPSLHTSYKFSERFSLQAGYSKRIFRPRLWDLNPFFNIRNNFSVRTGNPELQPEFTDSYEMNAIYILDNISMNFGLFHRYTTDVVERVSSFEDNVSTTKPLNIGTNRATGVEFNGKYSPAKWVTLNANFNYNVFNRKGAYEDVVFDFGADNWGTDLTSKFKLPHDFDIEISGDYRSKQQTVQSEIKDNFHIDLGLRKKFLKGKAVINLSVRDVFATRARESETLQQDFYLYNYGRRGRFVALGFSYGFGKGEAMEYSGGRRR